MMATSLLLRCDGPECASIYPNDRPLDGAIFTPAEVRAMAKRTGWKRDRVTRKDFCFDCPHGAPSARKGKAA
jgi:hypothetical protein